MNICVFLCLAVPQCCPAEISQKAPVKAQSVIPKKVQEAKPIVPVKETLSFNKEKFSQYKLVRMYLIQAGTMQYDPSNPELVLDTADKKGKLLPLTPFFKSRIGVTIELIYV